MDAVQCNVLLRFQFVAKNNTWKDRVTNVYSRPINNVHMNFFIMTFSNPTVKAKVLKNPSNSVTNKAKTTTSCSILITKIATRLLTATRNPKELIIASTESNVNCTTAKQLYRFENAILFVT